MRILISGGPGSGCTTTATKVGEQLRIPTFDSDSFFHKPSNPPYLMQYSPVERRILLYKALANRSSRILSGSVATWGSDSFDPTHGIFLATPKAIRLHRLQERQTRQLGARIDPEGDMQAEHEAFMKWAADYEEGTGPGRNFATDLEFLVSRCESVMIVNGVTALEQVVKEVVGFLL